MEAPQPPSEGLREGPGPLARGGVSGCPPGTLSSGLAQALHSGRLTCLLERPLRANWGGQRQQDIRWGWGREAPCYQHPLSSPALGCTPPGHPENTDRFREKSWGAGGWAGLGVECVT